MTDVLAIRGCDISDGDCPRGDKREAKVSERDKKQGNKCSQSTGDRRFFAIRIGSAGSSLIT